MEHDFKQAAERIVSKVDQQIKSRAYRAANELRNAELEVLRGKRTGRIYKKPHVNARYQASAPGEAPAIRYGHLRESWKPKTSSESCGKRYTVKPAITTNLPYAEHLEEGTKRMAARPYRDRIIDKAKPKIKRIFSEPYL